MFLVLPALIVIAVYVLAAVLPAYFLMRYIYRKDTIEKEPPMLLLSLVFMGVLAAFAAIVLEFVGQGIIDRVMEPNSHSYIIVLTFLVVAVAEEGAKLFFLWRRTWRDPNFNYRFDGVVYSVFVSLGFAAFENLRYVLGYGLSVAFPRAILAIPGHMGFAVFMGIFYGRAKECERLGNRRGMRLNLAAGYACAVLLHGFYDACAMLGTVLATVLFVAFVALMYIVVYNLVKRESAQDRAI